MRRFRRRGHRYLLAILATVVAALLCFGLSGWTGDAASFMPFVGAVLLTAWWAGLKPGLLATGLSAIIGDYFFMRPPYSMRIDPVAEALAVVLFVCTGVMASWFCETLHHYRRTAQRQADLLDNAYDAVFAWELGGSVVYWNRGAERLYGYTAEQAKGQAASILLRTAFPVPQRSLKHTLERNGEWAGELTQIVRDGNRIVVESRMVLVEEPQGRRLVFRQALIVG
jgi:PAS domain S-box-containing protein